jgi:hypothetical protein
VVTPDEQLFAVLLVFGALALTAIVVSAFAFFFVIMPMRGWWPWNSARSADRADQRARAKKERNGADS